MKKYCYFFGLLAINPLISTRYSSFTYGGKNSNHSSPPLKHAKHTQAVIPTVQTAPDKKYKRNIAALLGLLWLWTLASYYADEKRHRVHIWQSETGQWGS